MLLPLLLSGRTQEPEETDAEEMLRFIMLCYALYAVPRSILQRDVMERHGMVCDM